MTLHKPNAFSYPHTHEVAKLFHLLLDDLQEPGIRIVERSSTIAVHVDTRPLSVRVTGRSAL
jgi:hypothetical protein